MWAIAERHSREHAEINQAGFLRSTDQINVEIEFVFELLEKIASVRGLPHGTGGSRDDLFHLMTGRQLCEPAQGIHAAAKGSIGDGTTLRIPFSQAGG